MRGSNDEENMYELLYKLGLTKPDEDGSATFKKSQLVPEDTLRFYINAAFRFKHFISIGINFKDYA